MCLYKGVGGGAIFLFNLEKAELLALKPTIAKRPFWPVNFETFQFSVKACPHFQTTYPLTKPDPTLSGSLKKLVPIFRSTPTRLLYIEIFEVWFTKLLWITILNGFFIFYRVCLYMYPCILLFVFRTISSIVLNFILIYQNEIEKKM